MTITIQTVPFDHPDAADLRAALESELRARYGGDFDWGGTPTAGDTPVFLVARAGDEEAVGCGALRELEDRTYEIKRMFVRPSMRGTGLGRRILEHLEWEAAQLGALRVVLETGPEQPEARGLYERLGYRSIPCFGPYQRSALSRCYERAIEPALMSPPPGWEIAESA
jgi:GNAT superfamily N-acetyltransferase